MQQRGPWSEEFKEAHKDVWEQKGKGGYGKGKPASRKFFDFWDAKVKGTKGKDKGKGKRGSKGKGKEGGAKAGQGSTRKGQGK